MIAGGGQSLPQNLNGILGEQWDRLRRDVWAFTLNKAGKNLYILRVFSRH